MIFMLRNPDVMKRCQAEIDDVIGRKRAPSMRDKISTPYVEATLMEIQRMGDLVPFAVRKEFCIMLKIEKMNKSKLSKGSSQTFDKTSVKT